MLMSRLCPLRAARLGGLVVALSLLSVSIPVAYAQSDMENEALAAVTTDRVAVRDMVQRVPISGSLVARQEVLVYPDASGYAVTGLNADIGDHVEAGDVLAVLDARELTQKVSQARAELLRSDAAIRQASSQVSSAETAVTQAAQALGRTRSLRTSGAATKAALDDAEAAERTAQAALQSARDGVAIATAQGQQAQVALEIAEQNLEAAQVKAPTRGIISARNGQIGAIAAASGEPMFRLIRDGEVEVEVDVTETDLALLAVDQPAVLNVTGLPDLTGRVRLLAPVVDARSRLGTVRISVTEQEGLRPGVFVGGWVTVAERSNLSVPSTAIITDGVAEYVFLVKDGILERRAVNLGLLWQGWREVLSGLAEGDVVVARAGAFFAEGDAIRPVEASVPADAAATATVAVEAQQ